MRIPITEYKEQIIQGCLAPSQSPQPGEFWTFTEDGVAVAVDFLCPCGCGSECYTLVTDASKGQPKSERHWLYSKEPNGPTLWPSIRYTGGCKAHFNITDGEVIIHGDSGGLR